MVGSSHEALHRIFQKDPALLTKALQKVLHVPFPEPREIAALNVDADPQAKQMWRDLMTAIQYFWRHPLAEQVRAEGREQGLEQGRIQDRQEMTLRILEWRGIPVPDPVRERVMACTDLTQLEEWAQRAVRATNAAELFAEE